MINKLLYFKRGIKMVNYEAKARRELGKWKIKMSKKPSITNRISKGIQRKTNNLIPEKAHQIVTEAIKNMTKLVLTSSEYITRKPLTIASLEERENIIRERTNFYKRAATISGAGTGAGGILLGLADLPILLSLKMKFLFDIASIYGFDVKDYKERLYILYIFQLAFSSHQRRLEIYKLLKEWNNYSKSLPKDINDFDWRTFQQEYRDYIDLAKLLQLVPGIGAVVGAYANYRLMDRLGYIAMNAYRLRIIKN